MGDGICILIIDAQNDFHSGGSLAVAGADNDSERIAKMISSHIRDIESVIVTLDTHNIEHIAHSNVWMDANGNEPPPFTQIYSHEIGDKWFAKTDYLNKYFKEYALALEKKGRFTLTIWPNHCIIGTEGHAIVKSISNAIDSWKDYDEGRKVEVIKKGMNNFTEMYSAIEAEVPVESDAQTTTNFALINKLKQFRKVLVCGQASSHCVNYTLRDLVKYWEPRDTSDLILLIDGMSPVYGFGEAADKFITDMKSAGVIVKNTSDAMDDIVVSRSKRLRI